MNRAEGGDEGKTEEIIPGGGGEASRVHFGAAASGDK